MGELISLGDGIWTLDGPVAKDLLVVPYPTRMTVVRLADGGLWIASPIPCSFAQLAEIAPLGEVRHLLSPTPRHHWRLEEWHRLFPDALLWSCRLSAGTLGDRSLPTTILGEEAPDAWAGQLEQARFRARGFDEIAFFHRASSTVLLEDVVQAHRRGANPLANALIRFGGIGPRGGVPRDMRALARAEDARAFAERVLSWDAEQLVMAHGPIVREGAQAWLERAFAPLLGE